MTENDDALERLLARDALRPGDEKFTQRVLCALPRRSRGSAGWRRSFELATRCGLSLALLVSAQHWYVAGAGGADTVIALTLFLAPAVAAASRLCGPLIPRGFLRVLRRGARDWR
jgi:hypothetical protein